MATIRHIKGATRVLGEAQGYLALPVRDEIGQYGHQMTSSWELSPEELKQVQEGGSITITLLGQSHPPIILGVEDQ